MIYCCQHYTHDDYHTRCMTDAAYYLRDNEGKRVPGVWCEKHAREIIDEYPEKLGWHWTMEPIGEAS